MWSELQSRVARVENMWVRQLLAAILDRHGDRLRVWPAALMVHHAYRGGLLEHVLKLAEAGDAWRQPTARTPTCSLPAPCCTTLERSKSYATTRRPRIRRAATLSATSRWA